MSADVRSSCTTPERRIAKFGSATPRTISAFVLARSFSSLTFSGDSSLFVSHVLGSCVGSGRFATFDVLRAEGAGVAGASHAGTATIVNAPGDVPSATGGVTSFSGNAGTGSAFIRNDTGFSVGGGGAGRTCFKNNASAQQASIDNQGGLAFPAALTAFSDDASAGNARITSFGGKAPAVSGGFTQFFDHSGAGTARGGELDISALSTALHSLARGANGPFVFDLIDAASWAGGAIGFTTAAVPEPRAAALPVPGLLASAGACGATRAPPVPDRPTTSPTAHPLPERIECGVGAAASAVVSDAAYVLLAGWPMVAVARYSANWQLGYGRARCRAAPTCA